MPLDSVPASAAATPSHRAQRDFVSMATGRMGRVEETAPRYPSSTVLMATLTVAFLGLSLAFSARVIDTLGGRPGNGQLANIAAWTQLLFGCALTLMLWGLLVFPQLERSRLSWRMRWLALVGAGVIGCSAGFGIYQITENALLRDPTGSVGRRALQLHALANGLTDANVLAHDINVPPELLPAPAARAFLALLLATELRRSDSLVATPASLGTLMEGLVTQRLGTAAQVYDNVFVPSVRSLRDAFNAYVEAQMALAEDVRAIPDKQAQLWQDMQDAAARRLASARPGGGADAAAPADRAAFMAASLVQLREVADALYNERVIRLFGARLPPGLEWDAFVANPVVQTRWRAAIDAPHDAVLSATMGFQAFTDTVYRPTLERMVRPRLDELLAPAERFADGGPMAREATRAARWIVVPVLALGFGLLGIVWHTGALAMYLGTIMAPRWRLRRPFVFACLTVAFVLILGTRSAVTRTEGFERLENWMADRAGPVWLGARAGVEAESLVYLWGNRVRRIMLGSHDFGLESYARQPDDSPGSLDRLAN